MQPASSKTIDPCDISRMDNTIRFMKARRRGFNSEAFLQNIIEQQQADLDDRISTVSQELLQNQQKTTDCIKQLLTESEQIDVISAPKSQVENLQKTAQELKSVQQQLLGSLQTAEKEIEERSSLNKELQENLQILRINLKDTPKHFNSINTLYNTGQKACKKVSRSIIERDAYARTNSNFNQNNTYSL